MAGENSLGLIKVTNLPHCHSCYCSLACCFVLCSFCTACQNQKKGQVGQVGVLALPNFVRWTVAKAESCTTKVWGIKRPIQGFWRCSCFIVTTNIEILFLKYYTYLKIILKGKHDGQLLGLHQKRRRIYLPTFTKIQLGSWLIAHILVVHETYM